jgi:hypothetical protein
MVGLFSLNRNTSLSLTSCVLTRGEKLPVCAICLATNFLWVCCYKKVRHWLTTSPNINDKGSGKVPHIFLSWAAIAMADLPELQQYYTLADRLIGQSSKEELIRVKLIKQAYSRSPGRRRDCDQKIACLLNRHI